jgi:hypothetical protein
MYTCVPHHQHQGYGFVTALISAGVSLTTTTAQIIMSERQMANQRRIQRRDLVSQQQQLQTQVDAADRARTDILDADLAIADANIEATEAAIALTTAQTQQQQVRGQQTRKTLTLPILAAGGLAAFFLLR